MRPPLYRSKTAPQMRRIHHDENDEPFFFRREALRGSSSSQDAEVHDDFISKMLATSPLSSLFREDSRDQTEERFKADLINLAYTDRDLISIVNEDEAFRTLKTSLRQRGCTTNTYLRQTFHFFVAHVKNVRANRMGNSSNPSQRSSRRQRLRRQSTPLAA